jgi:hypothetical protein
VRKIAYANKAAWQTYLAQIVAAAAASAPKK